MEKYSKDENLEVESEETEEEIEETLEEQPDETEDHKNETEDHKNEEESQEDSELLEKYDRLNDQFIRLQADYANFKRRTENERSEYLSLGVEKLALDILPVLDNFDRALEMEEDKESSFYKGIELIRKQMYEIFEKQSIVEIDALDQAFDPNFHHAVLTEEIEGVEEGKVVDVLQKGYMHKDKVIRPSMVKVSQ